MTTFTIEQIEAMLSDATLGPWYIDQTYLGEVQKAGDLTIASCWAGVHESAKCKITGVNDCSLDEAAANAALIASAPTLATAHIAALKRVAELEADNERLTEALAKAEQACDERADRMDEFGPESECCAATARNCAADVSNCGKASA